VPNLSGDKEVAIIGEILFSRRDHADVRDVVRHVSGLLRQRVDEYDERRFDAQSDAEVVAALVRDLRIEPLHVDFDAGQKKIEELTLSVRDVFGDEARVPGLRVTKTFPFTGDPDLWHFGTGQWGSSMPQGEIVGWKLSVGMEVRASEGETAAAHITSTVQEIKHHLELQRGPLEEFNATLPGLLMPLVQERRRRRGAAQDLLDKF
jgi:hypothetical protein